jgi:pyruvate kinase
VTADAVHCRVVTPGTVHAHKGINFPGTPISAPSLTEKDKDDLKIGIAAGVDYVALSFVRGTEEIEAARKVMAEAGRDVAVIAKIERPEAVENLDDLLEHVDGIMIARGDLGVEMGPEAVPVLQKRLIAHANRRRRLVITATQMLESMTRHPQPTRAEASDVANAIFDGTDAVMLSAETATGDYPVETVGVMSRLVCAAEEALMPRFVGVGDSLPGMSIFPEAICEATAAAAEAVGATAIVAFTESGATARLMSKQRPTAPVVAFTPFEPIRQRMALYWGVLPMLLRRMGDTEARVAEVDRWMKDMGLGKPGDRIVIVSGTMVGLRGGTNTMKLHEIA